VAYKKYLRYLYGSDEKGGDRERKKRAFCVTPKISNGRREENA
jgi:hypothetical protein